MIMGITDQELQSLLLSQRLVDQRGLEVAMKYAADKKVSLADAVVDKDLITDEKLGMLIAAYFRIPYVSVSRISIPIEIVHIIPERIARTRKAIPFMRDQNGIKLAMANPRDNDLLQTIIRKTGAKIIPHYATERDINNTLYIFKKDLQKSFDALVGDAPVAAAVVDPPVLKIVDLLIEHAYNDKASDIHVEPQEKNSLVRFRIDGILHDVLSYPKKLHERIITRIKVLSNLRTDEHMAAQDGKMRAKIGDQNVDMRISMLPIVEGEKVVIRLLVYNSKQVTLHDLGMTDSDLKKVTTSYGRTFGMILSTGPTGSGKSTSIYSILRIINTREKNITTIEDPVEYRLVGINQIQVNAKTNLTFAAGLRAILRQDPNVVFVGEIRDNETAGIAVNAALTGHLVLSTLHTNDAAGALPRLSDMKVEPFLVASTVNCIIGQRLVRKICESCKTPYSVTMTELSKNIAPQYIQKFFGNAPQATLYKGAGCKVCHFTGYQGRLGIYEVLVVSEKIKEMISQKMDADAIFGQAVTEGMTSMLDDGLQKVAKGTTSIEEVLRVTKI